MAKKRTKRRSSKKSSSGGFVSPQRKKELLGLLLMGLAALVSLAILTFSPEDNELARSFSFSSALSPSSGAVAQNAGGHVGAALAYLLVPNFLGYCSLLLTGLLLVWGYVIFRNRQTVYLPLLTVLLGLGAFVLAAVIGWMDHVIAADLSRYGGGVGTGVAGWMQQIFGGIGSFIILILLLATTILLVVDRDIQRSMDRLEAALQRLRERAGHWKEDLERRRAERKERLASKREERARARQERARKRETEKTSNAPASTAETKESSPAEKPDTPPEPARETTTAPAAGSMTVNDRFRQSGAEHPGGDGPFSAMRRQETKSQPRTESTDSPVDIELKVRDRIEEEKTDDIQREAKVEGADIRYDFPPIDLLDEPDTDAPRLDPEELEQNKNVLLQKLETHNIEIAHIEAVSGPTVTRYELTPASGIKISRITALQDDLAMAMAARGLRMIAPIPGKSAVGVEVANRRRELVRIRDVIGTARFRDAEMELPMVLGKTIEGGVYIQDLTKMPHLLIAGATGSGKSVGLNAFIAGLLYACHPANLKFVMIDPKKIELQQYTGLVEHYIAMPEDGEDPLITDVDEALGVLKSCEKEMEHRYDLLALASVRGIIDYNKKFAAGRLNPDDGHERLPYLVVIIDELADLMMTAGKEIEGPITRLAQMARAVGIHLVLATQRPSTDVITGLIKANFPSRIAYQVPSQIDSRTILDARGAERLVGNGDMLYMNGSRVMRLQGPYVSIDEVDRLMDFVSRQPRRGPYVLPPAQEVDSPEASQLGLDDADELFDEAARIIVRYQQGSVSLLQRKLSVGYTRAARIVDQLEEAGIVGPFVGSKARDVLVESEEDLDELFYSRDDD